MSKNDSIFYDIHKDFTPDINILIVIGGRGIGKTYSGLQWLIKSNRMLYVRNQADEIQLCCSDIGNPFKSINRDFGFEYEFVKKGGMYRIYEGPEEKTEYRGIGVSLATAGKLKGFDLSDVDRLIWDEFIPDPDLVIRFDEGQAFLRFYETVARNREILGKEPLKALLLSNATQISSRALHAFGVADLVENMVRHGIRKATLPAKKIKIVFPVQEELMKLKENTALYQASGKDSKFARNAINNEFVDMSLRNVKKRKLVEYIPLCAYEDMYIYKHKHRKEMYVCSSYADVEVYTELDTKNLFIRRFFEMKDEMLNGTFIYATYQIKKKFLSLFFK